MKRWLCVCGATTLLMVAPIGYAAFHLFTLEQIYSNADGSVQFVVLTVNSNGENQWTSQTLVSSGPGPQKAFTFPSDLPFATSGHRVLVATQGFAALGLVTPDYVIPNGFLQIPNGTVNYAGVDQVTYSALPTDGVHALDRSGALIQNQAKNFAGATGSVAAAPSAFTPVAGLWANANELGTGYTLEFKHGVLVVAIYAYTSAGAAQWYLASGPVTANVFTATLDKYTGGQCISCPFTRSPGPPTGNDGTMTITFTSSTSAIVNLPGGRVTTISPFQF